MIWICVEEWKQELMIYMNEWNEKWKGKGECRETRGFKEEQEHAGGHVGAGMVARCDTLA